MPNPPADIPGLPELRAVEQHVVRPDAPVEATITASARCTPSEKSANFVRHIELDLSGTPLEGRFAAGQSFGVIPPGTDNKGRPHKLRLYSIASPSAGEHGNGSIIATTVKRTIEEHWDDHSLLLGVCSNYLCDRQPDDKIWITGPSGKRFVLPANPLDHDYVFFATGTGIAPFRGMLHDLLAAGHTGNIVVLMGVPYESDLLYDGWLRELATAHPNLTYLTTFSRQINPDCGRKLYVQDRLATHADLLGEVLASERTLVYQCGLAGMELGIFQGLRALLPPEQLAWYVKLHPEIIDSPEQWQRRMIPRKITPTKRMFLEVY